MPTGYPTGQTVVSELGTGTGTYLVEGGLQPGQVISVSASCDPGEDVKLTVSGADSSILGTTFPCANPSGSWHTGAPATGTVPAFEVTVETTGGAPFWLTAWVHEDDLGARR